MGGGAKISWVQGRKVPKYGPSHYTQYKQLPLPATTALYNSLYGPKHQKHCRNVTDRV